MIPFKNIIGAGEATWNFLLTQVLGIIIFALIYFVLNKRSPRKHFKGLINNPWFDMLYFSTVTQSTVGYGDIVPISKLARGIAIVQLLLVYAGLGVSAATLSSAWHTGKFKFANKNADETQQNTKK
jgi:voltage-gated potassium channel